MCQLLFLRETAMYEYKREMQNLRSDCDMKFVASFLLQSSCYSKLSPVNID